MADEGDSWPDSAADDAAARRIANLTGGSRLAPVKIPEFLREMIEMGGVIPYIKAQLALARQDMPSWNS